MDSMLRSFFSREFTQSRWVLCSEDSIFEIRPSTIRVLYYESSWVQSSSLSKVAMFRRFYFRMSPVVYGSCVTKILLCKSSIDIVCSHDSQTDCLSTSVIRRQCVYPPKNCVTWSRTPTLWIEAHIFFKKKVENVWNWFISKRQLNCP